MKPSTKPVLKQVILDALAAKYTSESCQDGIKTGNSYQTLRLGDDVTAGFRGSRDSMLSRVRFGGQKVLDLGSNLGELSRYARRRGADRVDGLEYEAYFVEIANLANAYNDVSRVSFQQGDITDTGLCLEPYDIVLGFSVFTYLSRVLSQVASVTRKLLIIETHKLEGNLESGYVKPLRPFFPCHRELGTTDWGTSERHSGGQRRVLAFARSEAMLEQMIDADGVTESAASDTRLIDLWESRFNVFDSFRRDISELPVIDWGVLAGKLRERETDPGKLADDPQYRGAYSGWPYWVAFLKGLDEFRRGKPAGATTYAAYLRDLFRDTNFDPGLGALFANDERYAARIQLRYLDALRIQAGDTASLAPTTAFASPALEPSPIELSLCCPNERVACRAFDGYHRVFSALISGVRYVETRIKA